MATFRIEITRTDHLADFPRIFEEEAAVMLVTVGLDHQTIAKQIAPKYLETFRNGFTFQIQRSGPAQMEGNLINTAPHARVVEGIDLQGNDTPYGRRPGAKFPPVNVLAQWVSKVLGIAGPQLRQVTYLVGRKIVREGIIAERTSKVAYSFKAPEFQRMFEQDLPAKVEARL